MRRAPAACVVVVSRFGDGPRPPKMPRYDNNGLRGWGGAHRGRGYGGYSGWQPAGRGHPGSPAGGYGGGGYRGAGRGYRGGYRDVGRGGW